MGKRCASDLPVWAFLLVAACGGDQFQAGRGHVHSTPKAGVAGSGIDAGVAGSSDGAAHGAAPPTGGHSGGGVAGTASPGGRAGASSGGRAGASSGGSAGKSGGSANGGSGGASGGSANGGSGGASGGSANGGSGGASGGSGNGGSGGASGGSANGGSGALCGSDTCASTRCAGWDCGAAACCTIGTGLTCVHGSGACPPPYAGETQGLLACWARPHPMYIFGKGCAQKSECFVAEHYGGCCNVHALGLNVSEQSRFASFEQSCGGAPPCDCCCDRVTADDGQIVPSGMKADVDCVGGVCTSRVP